MLRRVYLHGPLEKRYGRGPYEIGADDLGQLLAGLRLHCPGLKQELMRHANMAIIKVMPDGEARSISQDELKFGFGSAKELHLNVSITMAGAETFALAVASYGSAAYYAAYAFYTLAMMYVMSQVISGLQDTITTEDAKPENRSALFDGPENRNRQGARVQLNYGRCRVGSVTLNQQMSAVRQALIRSDNYTIDVSTTGSFNLFSNDIFVINPVVTSFTINGVTTAAGGTYTLAGVSQTTITAAGAVTIVSLGTISSYDITVVANDTGVSPTQSINETVTVAIVVPETVWDNSGGGGPGGDSGGGDGTGGGAGGGDAAGVGSAGA